MIDMPPWAKLRSKCVICQRVIYNKPKNAKYCQECADAVNRLYDYTSGVFSRFRKEFPKYKPMFSIELRCKHEKSME